MVHYLFHKFASSIEADALKGELKCYREYVDCLSQINQTCSDEKSNHGRVFIEAPPAGWQEIHLETLA